HFAELDAIINAWAAHKSVANCVQLMTQAGVACGPIVTLDTLEHESNLVHRGMLRRLDDPETGESVRIPASPIRGTPLCGLNPTRIPRRNEDRRSVQEML